MSLPAIKLLQFTDTHLYGDESMQLRGVATYPALLRTLAQARLDIAAADALLVTGDLVQDDVGGYEVFRRVFSNLGKPVYCIPGNHDIVYALEAALAQPPFQVGGLVDFGGWRVIMLDSSLPGLAQGELAPKSLEFLDRSLAEARGRHALVCLHHHPVNMGSRWLDGVRLTNAADLFAVLDCHPNVRAMAWGHVHQAFEGWHNDVRLFGTPATCTQFLPGSTNFALDQLPPAYRRLTLNADGSVESDVVWAGRAGEARGQDRSAISQNSLRA
jgi:Icc protein